MSGTVHLEHDGDVAVLVIDNPPVNAGSHDVREALLRAVAAVDADPAFRAAVLIGAGKSFIAGSDLREFDLPLAPPQLPAVIEAIERSSKPIVAALHGAALGGGYELALACDARIAAPRTVVGLPETTLGIIPGAGGTQKLPRLVGIARAIALICSGRRVAAGEALQLGMVDALAEGDLRMAAVERARSLVGSGKHHVIDRAVPHSTPEEIEAAERKALASGRNMPQIAAAIAHIKAAATTPATAALQAERGEFEQLRVAPVAKALRHIFFAEREATRGHRSQNVAAMAIRHVGIVGAGTMGAGIATAFLQSGYAVTLTDKDGDALSRGRERVHAALEKSTGSGRLSAEAHMEARANLDTSTELESLATCDLIIEAVIEDLAAKQAVFRQIDSIARVDAILATNTSYLDVDAIAASIGRPTRVIGLHFFNPAHIMKLVEVVTGKDSADDALAAAMAVVKGIGKLPVEAGNSFGFIGNRIYAAYRASCEFMLEDGALPHEVDAALEAFGFAMGPFAVSDLSGLDIAWRMRQAQTATRDPGSRYVDIPDRLCEAGRFGQKSGAGYYRYSSIGQRERDPEVEDMIRNHSAAKGIERRSLTAPEIQERALAAIVNEAGLVLAEGVARRAGDIDVVLVNGYGFPRWRGGPLHWARQQDPEQLIRACADFVAAAGSPRTLADLAGLGLLGNGAAPQRSTT